MSWASQYIAQLKAGNIIKFRPRGNSMTGKINSGQLVTIKPIDNQEELFKGDIVLCSVSGHHYLHLISAIKNNRYQISNNHGYINGWTGLNQIYGKVILIEF